MFKLESYLTPLILNYVDKYIKNLKPEDSQFSLWGGDAVFCNLDLRLDVLEEELQLPFTFVNGHIHELRIHVPWTKLGSEPVVITINTIECILKLCGDESTSDCGPQKVIQSKKSPSARSIKRPEIAEAPPGYVQSLINRVISNICIICNNLILKYVEDDVVLSLNIKSAELYNVNEKWERAFVDINLTDGIVRKVINMQDLTVCLDKRDASGKIETYQDPLLYRCSTTWRLYSIYNTLHSKYPSLTRIHMYCENLEFSLTDQQLPMFLRLLCLCVALQNRGTFTDKESSDNNENSDVRINISEESSDIVAGYSQEESWGSWAWSFIPEVPLWNSAMYEEQEEEANMLMAKKIFQFGIFIGKASCTLKQTVLSQDNIFCSPPKFTFVPLMILHFYGCSMEFTSKGKDFLNVQAGVSGATITGLEDCVCGYQEFCNSDNERRVFLKSGVPPSSGHAYSYLSASLFDPLAAENCGQSRKYSFNPDEHLETLTEEVMVQRFPAFSLDYMYELEIPEEWTDCLSNVTTTFLEESNWHERSICRLVFGPLCIDITSSFVHRLSKLLSSLKDYDYPSYSASKKLPAQNLDLTNDIVKQLEEFVPSRQYHLTLFKPVIRLFIADHYSSLKQDNKKGKKKRMKHLKLPKGIDVQFYFEIFADCMDLQAIVPMYPSRLVTIANNYSSPILLHHCYRSDSMKLFGLEMSLEKEGEDLRSEHSIVERTSVTFFMKTLILPEQWINHDDLALKEYSFECTNLSLRLCEVRLLAAFSMFLSWTVKYLNIIGLQKLKSDVLNSKAGTEEIFGEIYDIRCSFLQSDKISFTRGSVASVSLKFQNEGKISVLFHAPELTQDVHKGVSFQELISDNSKDRRKLSFLQFILQVPDEVDYKSPPLFIFHISGSTFCLEPAFLSWLSLTSLPSFDLTQHIDEDLFRSSPTDLEDESTCSSMTQEASVSQTLTKSQSTVLVAYEHCEFHKRLEDILLKHSEFLSILLLEVEIGSLCGLLPNDSWCIQHVEGSSVLYSWSNTAVCNDLKQAFIMNFPLFKIRNNNSASIFDKDPLQCSFPIRCSVDEKKGADCFPWNLQMDSFSAFTISKRENSVNIDYLLQPTAVSATIAITSKSNQNQLGLCIHMDSKFLGINLSTIHTALVADCIRSLSVFTTFAEKVKSWISYFHLKSDLSESNSVNPEICVPENNFQCTNYPTKVDISNEKVSPEDSSNENKKKLTLWSQLTLSKLSLVLLGKLLPEAKYENFKIHFDVEEIISSLDIQDVYSKIKIKLTSLNSNCFTSRSEKAEWKPGPFDGVMLFCNNIMPKAMKTMASSQHSHAKSDNQPFMVATYTKALCSNAKEKWMSKQDSKEKLKGLDFISEIDIKVKSFDLILWPSLFDITYQILIPFIKLYQASSYNCVNIVSDTKYPSGISFCNQNLPLLYIESNIIQLYLPDNSLLTCGCDKYVKSICDKKQSANDVLMLQFNYITLTSQVENPLPRIVLNPELYNAAVNSKSASFPGAAIEDRQYQMDINGFALGSLSGKNMLWNKNPKKDITLHHPLTMGENPALEWNIGVMPENRNISSDTAIISPIISPLNIRVAVAPAIVCDNPCKKDAQNKIIVAGISIEVSVTNDIYLYLSIDQSCFIYSLLKTNMKFLLDVLTSNERNLNVCNFEESVKENVLDKQDLDDFPFVIPSCFTHVSHTCPDSSMHSCKIEKTDQQNFIPFELLLTAGTISIMFFYHADYNDISSEVYDMNKSTEKLNSEQYQDMTKSQHPLAKAFEGINKVTQSKKNIYKPSHLHPFLCVSITQPHSYLLCQPSTQKFESSCFDLQLYGSSSSYIVKKPHEACVPVSDDFLLSYVETKPGEPNAKTGIPPSFFTVSCIDFLNYPSNVKIFIERPVKFNLRTDICDSTMNFIQRFQSKLKSVNVKLDSVMDSLEFKSIQPVSLKPNLAKFLKDINLYTTQVVIELIPEFDDSCQKLVLTCGNISMEIGIETFKDEIKSVHLKTDVSGFTLQFCNSNERWSFLQPLTFSLKQKCHISPWFQIELHFIGESMLFNFSFHHIMKLNQFISAFQEQFKKQKERFETLVKLHEASEVPQNEKMIFAEGRKRQYWNDDLRKGSFQFIQACDHNSEPKALEIVFSRASSIHPASMTWRYPEPRALTKIEVSPVPFQCEEGRSIKDRQVLTCYLQYWNSAQQEYLYMCDFMLSETEHYHLDLPDLTSSPVAVSDKWRVLLDCKSYIDDDGVVEIESPCLSPLALAACMSIDSCFDPSLIPFIQVQASYDLLKVSMFNYFDRRGCSPALYPFEFDDEAPKDQEFAVLSFMNPSFSCTNWSYKLKLSFSSGITFEVIELRNLTVLPIISPVDIICNGSVMYDDDERPVYDLDLVLHPCFIRVSQSVVHTLTFSAYSILKDLLESENTVLCSEYILPNYYLICNNIQECIRFGQVDTEEYIILSPLKMHAYSWWCHKKKQMLRVSFGSSHWKWSEEFSIDVTGVQTVLVDNSFTIIVRVKSLSNLQKQIVIDGQLIAHSELNFPIQMKCDFSYFSQAKIKGSNSFIVKSLAPESTTPTFLLPLGQSKNFKLSITGILDSHLWSEEVSFGDNKLIKIPWKNSYQNVWCQLAHQKLNDTIFISVYICPLFVLRSNLPFPLKVDIVPQNTTEKYSVDLLGKGQEVKLLEGSEWDHKLQIFFHTLTDLHLSVSSISVSVCDLSEITLTSFEENINLEETCYNMQPMQDKMWPYSFLERICHPVTVQDIHYPCFEICNNFIPATVIKKMDLSMKVEKFQHWAGLNTLLIDIKPHAMIINRLRMNLYFFDAEELQWILPQNSVAIPFNIHEDFRFGIKIHNEYLYSPVLTIEKLSVSPETSSWSNAFTFPLSSSQHMQQNGSVNVLIKLENNEKKIYLFKVISEIHEGIIVITVFPVMSALNKTGRKLHLSLTCLPNTATNVTFPYEVSNPVILSEREICEPLLFWNVIPFNNYSNSDYLDLNFYICASINEYEDYLWSYPVCFHPLLAKHNRHTLAIPVRNNAKLTTLPISISSHKWRGMLLLVIDNDPSPMLLLHNQTNMNLFYGQSVSDSEGKFVFEEFQEHKIIPVLQPDSSSHYTFPTLLEKFPLIIDKIPMLCLGLVAENGGCIWSAPFHISIDKQFVHILGLCDFMINCRQVGHTVYLYIDPVNRIELTAKEVRSRIALATNTNGSSAHNDDNEAAKLNSSLNKKAGRKSKLTNLEYRTTLKNPVLTEVKDLFILYLNIRVVHTSLILCDEFKEKNKISEVMRLNIDNALFVSRPEVESLGYRLQEIFLCFEQIQLDNQLDNENDVVYDFPVIFQRHVDSNAQTSTAKESDLFMINKVKENSVFIFNAVFELPFNECNNITVQSLNIKLLPVSLYIEDTFCYRLMDLMKSYSSIRFHNHNFHSSDIYFSKKILDISHIYLYPVYFQELKISIPEVTLSLHASLKLYLSLENSLLKFQPFEKDNLFTTSYEVGKAFVLHYLTGALFRAGWVVGSLDLLGNPAGFARAVGAGVTDFVYLPYKGLLSGPRAFISGLSSGALSLFTQISSGAIICMANLASSISRNMDYLCLDSEHLARQEILRHHLPQGVSEGLIQGLSGLGLSLLSAVAGIADHPLQALMSPTSPMKTASGIVSGLGKGLVGVFTKPIGGAAELLSQTGYGLLHGAGWLALPKRQYQSVTLALDVLSSSYLKYACKIAQCVSLGEVLASLEATYVNETGEYEKNILLLTSEALCILAEDEITLQRTFALSEIGCKKAESDLSTLVVIPSAMCKKQIFLESCGTVDRVVEYIIKNREENHLAPSDDFSEFLSKSTASCHVFYLYPRDRSLFMTLFSFAKNRAMGKGFVTDC